jgi:hypothetical protein
MRRTGRMKLQDVIERALIDTNFANQLRHQAMVGQKAGKGTKAWEAFMQHFAEDSEQLMKFTNMVDKDDPKCTATTALTTTVTSTAICTLTTTTMTTSIFCG